MKTLSLTQPWASLVAIGAKHIETRSWGSAYRGWLAIHASKGFPREDIELCLTEPFKADLGSAYATIGDIPRGAIVAIGNLHHVGPIRQNREGAFCVYPKDWPVQGKELEYGWYEATGRFGWIMSNIIRLDEPIPAKGALGLWDWTPPGGLLERLGIAELAR